MKITKFGHCCLLVEEAGVRLLTDPGTFTTEQDSLTDVDAILITHEHADHFHVESVKKIMAGNPAVLVITNAAVGKLLEEAGIAHTVLADGETQEVKGVTIAAREGLHAEMYKGWARVANTAFFVAEKLYYPGDAFLEPGYPIDVLALPVAGPWMKISEAIEYAIALKPRVAFPVHDGILKHSTMMHRLPAMFLEKEGIEFVSMGEGDVHEF